MYHLLIVDDETAITDGLEEVLLSSGLNLIEVRKAYSARQALELFQKRLFDIVISDIRMPGMDGLKMIEAVSYTHLPLIQKIPSHTLPLKRNR